eukprot:1726534-Rhodomonas_salina.1
MCCDLHLPLVTTDGNNITIILCDVIYDPNGDINLISTDNINRTDWDINLSRTSREGMYHYSHCCNSPTAKINLRHAGWLLMLPICHEDGFFHDPKSFFAKCGNLSVEELFHMRMAHTPIE